MLIFIDIDGGPRATLNPTTVVSKKVLDDLLLVNLYCFSANYWWRWSMLVGLGTVARTFQ